MKYIFTLISLLIITVSVSAADSDSVKVFTQKGCSRCEYTIKFLKEHKIRYTEYPVETESNNSKMWSAIEESGNPEVDSITMPVVIINDEVYFSIENIEEFCKKLLSEN